MVAYNFKQQFAERIREGSKFQTIRRIGKRRHARRGEALQLYTGQRTTSCEKIMPDALCVTSERIEILIRDDGIDSITIGDSVIDPAEFEAFARDDGFESLADMSAFFQNMHGPGLFVGQFISWVPGAADLCRGCFERLRDSDPAGSLLCEECVEVRSKREPAAV